MTPSDMKNLLQKLERVADECDATNSWRARSFREVIIQAYGLGWDDGYTAGEDDEHQAVRATEKRAKAAAEEQQ